MARSMWRGAIQFGLVTIPVKLYLATESRGGLSFNLLHKDDLQRIQMKTYCPEHGEIPRSDTVRGYEWSKGPTGFGARALLSWLGTPEPLKGIR